MSPIIFWVLLFPFPQYVGNDGGFHHAVMHSTWDVCKQLESDSTIRVFENSLDDKGLSQKEITIDCGAITKQDK